MGSSLEIWVFAVRIFAVMARPLRIEYPGALYHITSRGNAGQNIFLNSEDGNAFLEQARKSEQAGTVPVDKTQFLFVS